MMTDSATRLEVPATEGLEALTKRALHDLATVNYPPRQWVQARTASDGGPILDVLIIGGGQGGLAVATGLMREKVNNLLVVDRNPRDHEGPWRTFARMKTLRTPKHVLGPDQGIPSLAFKTWFEAQHGVGAWDRVGLIPKETWADYLYWIRGLFGVPYENETTAGALAWDAGEDAFRVPLTHHGETRTVLARRVVLATGIEGSGDWKVPDFITRALPAHRYAHTRTTIDFEALKGRRIAVLGAGASAFDNASVALETGAAEVHLYFRRKQLVRVNAYRWAEFVGFLKHHADLPDPERWRVIHRFVAMGQLPPADTYARARQHDDFHLHPASPWESVKDADGGVTITTPSGTQEVDFIIVGTGFVTDLSLRPELAGFHDAIKLWSDAYTPPPEERSADLERHPYLGAAFEFQPRDGSDRHWLTRIHNYTFGSLVSLGLGGASISGMKYSVRRVVDGITREIYREQAAHTYTSLADFNVIDFDL